MDKIIDITKELEKAKENEEKKPENPSVSKATNPILKNLAKFTNQKLSKKFDIKDLLR